MDMNIERILEKQELCGDIIKNVDISQNSLKCLRFEDCLFEQVLLNNTNLEKCHFTECTFRNCNLSLVNVKSCRFHSVEFIECKLVGINWYDLDENSLLGNSFIFDKCILTDSSFSCLTLPNTKFIECRLVDVDFSDADFRYSDFSYSNCSHALFHHTNLTECNFNYATNYNINIYNNIIELATFTSPDAINLLSSSGIIVNED